MEKDQIEYIKSIINKIVGENKFVNDALRNGIEAEEYNLIEINLSHCNGCYYKDGQIIIGIKFITNCYRLSKDLFGRSNFQKDSELTCNLNQFYTANSSNNFMKVYVDDCEKDRVCSEIVDAGLFLKDNPTSNEIKVIFALAFSLFHEIGHFVYDRYVLESQQKIKEKLSDCFAFTALLPVYSRDDKQFVNCAFEGILLAFAGMLINQIENAVDNDQNHPHTIERMYELFRFWDVEDESPHWKLAYTIIDNWTNKQKIEISWINDTALSFKDKVNNAYEYFRKK